MRYDGTSNKKIVVFLKVFRAHLLKSRRWEGGAAPVNFHAENRVPILTYIKRTLEYPLQKEDNLCIKHCSSAEPIF